MKQTYFIQHFGKIMLLPILFIMHLTGYLFYAYDAKKWLNYLIPTFKDSNLNLFIALLILIAFFGIVFVFYQKIPKIILALFVLFIYFIFLITTSYFEELHEESLDFYINNPDYPEQSLSDFNAAGSLMWLIITPFQIILFFIISFLFDKLKNKLKNNLI